MAADLPRFHDDPVRAAVARYLRRFPEERDALHTDAVTAAMFKHIERCLVQADIAMQDEGLNPQQRLRVITAALYGSIDEEAAVARRTERDAMLQQALAAPVPGWMVGEPKDAHDAALLRSVGFLPKPGSPPATPNDLQAAAGLGATVVDSAPPEPQIDDGRAWLIPAGGNVDKDALLCGARWVVDGTEHVCVRELHCEKHGKRAAPADPSKEN